MVQLLALGLIVLGLPGHAQAARVAVMEFENASADPDWEPLGKGFQEMFLVDLDKAEAVEVISRHTLRDKEQELSLPSPTAAEHRKVLASGAGATHLLYGSFRIDGQEMELRVEVLDAEQGRIVLQDSRAGSADTFFDLQKQALQASIGALSLDLSPRERAETGRLHTADFMAFQDFSRGLDLFDAERYEASLQALRSATERDVQFGLARLTLEAYEELIAQTRARASAIHSVRVEERRLERLEGAGEEVEVVRRLLEIARREGPDHTRLRLTALHTLAVAYGNVGGRKNKLQNLRRIEDRFAMARAADQLWARYHNEAMSLWPKLPVQPDESFYCNFPSLDTFDEDLEKCAEQLWTRGNNHPDNRRNYLLSNIRYPYHTARALHLPKSEEVALHDRFVEMAAQLNPSDVWLKHEDEARLKSYREVLRFDDATRMLEAEATRTDNEWRLKGLAREMEVNRDLVALIEQSGQPQTAREWVILGLNGTMGPSGVLTTGRRLFAGRALDHDGRHHLTRFRRLSRRGYILLDDVPLWSHHPNNPVSRGPVLDARRTTALRYYQAKPDILPSLFFGGATPISSPVMRTTLRYRVPDEFRPHRDVATGLVDGRPKVVLLFGLVDLDVPLQTTAAAEKARFDSPSSSRRSERELTRPMQGYMLRIHDNRVEIARIVETTRGSFDRKEGFDIEVLDSANLRRPGDELSVEIEVDGDQVVAKVGSAKLSARLPSPPHGFIGLGIEGPGFVEIHGLTVTGQAEPP